MHFQYSLKMNENIIAELRNEITILATTIIIQSDSDSIQI